MEIAMKKLWKSHQLTKQTGFIYPYILFILMLWMILILSGIEEIKTTREQLYLNKEMYELHTLYYMTKHKLRDETEDGPFFYDFPNGKASVHLTTKVDNIAYYRVELETNSESFSERAIILPNIHSEK